MNTMLKVLFVMLLASSATFTALEAKEPTEVAKASGKEAGSKAKQSDGDTSSDSDADSDDASGDDDAEGKE